MKKIKLIKKSQLNWLKENSVESVAIELTEVCWILPQKILDEAGLEVS
jgi:hypothetical protein